MTDINTPIKPGDKFSASLWEALRRIAQRVSNLRVAAPLVLQSGPGGITLGIELPTGSIWAKILSGTGPYVWREQIPLNGTWTDGARTGTSAIEVNGNTAVPVNTRVRLDLSRGVKSATFIFSKCS